jgi:hypothetical protein
MERALLSLECKSRVKMKVRHTRYRQFHMEPWGRLGGDKGHQCGCHRQVGIQERVVERRPEARHKLRLEHDRKEGSVAPGGRDRHGAQVPPRLCHSAC